MLESISRGLFLSASKSRLLKRAVSRYGMRGPHGFARRFIGGESLDDVMATLHTLGGQGFSHTLNHLGEHVTSRDAAHSATAEYLATVDKVGLAGLSCKISIKLSQIGLEIDPDYCVENLRTIVIAAKRHGGFVRIDMEGSRLVDETLQIFERVWTDGHRNVGVVLQSYLHRTAADLQRILDLGARVRLVKGAYNEPSDIAYPQKVDVDAAFVRLAHRLLIEGATPAFATHDPRMITAVRAFAEEQGVGNDAFEFQMLYGVRRDLQTTLLAGGYGVRVYVPFGSEWFPYFMRRLAERPANVGFIIRGVLYEQRGS